MNKVLKAWEEISAMERSDYDEDIPTSVEQGMNWFEAYDIDVYELLQLVRESLTEIMLSAIAEGAAGAGVGPAAIAVIWFKVGFTVGRDLEFPLPLRGDGLRH